MYKLEQTHRHVNWIVTYTEVLNQLREAPPSQFCKCLTNVLCHNFLWFWWFYNKRYLMSTFENYEIFALSKSEFNKLSNDTRFIKRKCYFWSYEKKMVYISILSLYFTIYFAPYLKTSLADLWWCVTFNILFPNQDIRLSHHITYIFYHVIRLLSNNMDFIIVQPNCFQNHF